MQQKFWRNHLGVAFSSLVISIFCNLVSDVKVTLNRWKENRRRPHLLNNMYFCLEFNFCKNLLPMISFHVSKKKKCKLSYHSQFCPIFDEEVTLNRWKENRCRPHLLNNMYFCLEFNFCKNLLPMISFHVSKKKKCKLSYHSQFCPIFDEGHKTMQAHRGLSRTHYNRHVL